MYLMKILESTDPRLAHLRSCLRNYPQINYNGVTYFVLSSDGVVTHPSQLESSRATWVSIDTLSSQKVRVILSGYGEHARARLTALQNHLQLAS